VQSLSQTWRSGSIKAISYGIKISWRVFSLKNSKKLKIIFIFLMIFIVIIGLTKINVINTKALSPLDNTNDNYEKISQAFGEDFSKFIKDDASIKIYKDDSEEILVRVGENDFSIKKESNLINGAEKIAEDVEDFFTSIKDKVEKVIM
jgi:uncharacterized protein YxeA